MAMTIGCVTGSTIAHLLAQASIPEGAQVHGFSLDVAETTGSLTLAYAYNIKNY